jgi:hypothetical protein
VLSGVRIQWSYSPETAKPRPLFDKANVNRCADADTDGSEEVCAKVMGNEGIKMGRGVGEKSRDDSRESRGERKRMIVP